MRKSSYQFPIQICEPKRDQLLEKIAVDKESIPRPGSFNPCNKRDKTYRKTIYQRVQYPSNPFETKRWEYPFVQQTWIQGNKGAELEHILGLCCDPRYTNSLHKRLHYPSR